MALENKLGISDFIELAHMEERGSKAKALRLFETGLLDTFEVGTFSGLLKFIGFFLMRSMTLQEKYGQSILQRAVSVLPL